MNLIDIHAHVHFPDYDHDREEVLRRTREAACGVINIGTDLATSQAVLKLAQGHELTWAAVGVHPHNTKEEIDWTELESLARAPQVVAIGECGLDFGRDPKREAPSPQEISQQQEIFAKQIEVARKVGKPLMIHCRNAYEEVFEMLNSEGKVHLHFFAGDWPTAERFLGLGCTLSFTGVLTFTDAYDEVVRRTPLDRIMAETDAPYVAPVPHRGKRNEPLYVAEVVAAIARIKSLPPETVREAVVANARRVFGLPDGLPK
jgi:TatD DNase family protein